MNWPVARVRLMEAKAWDFLKSRITLNEIIARFSFSPATDTYSYNLAHIKPYISWVIT